MIGHFLGTLTTEQEDRVLVGHLVSGQFTADETGARCIIGTAFAESDGEWDEPNLTQWKKKRDRRDWMDRPNVAYQYDDLCSRFGAEQINAAIRNRILANRAYRALAGVSREAVVR